MSNLVVKVRFDFVGRSKSGKVFGRRSSEQAAEELRQHKVSMMRNVPIQGIMIDDIDMSHEVYAVIDEVSGKEVAYAPVVVSFKADSIDDALKFLMKEEFRTVQIVEPQELVLSGIDVERLIQRVNEELLNYKRYLERKIDNWR